MVNFCSSTNNNNRKKKAIHATKVATKDDSSCFWTPSASVYDKTETQYTATGNDNYNDNSNDVDCNNYDHDICNYDTAENTLDFQQYQRWNTCFQQHAERLRSKW